MLSVFVGVRCNQHEIMADQSLCMRSCSKFIDLDFPRMVFTVYLDKSGSYSFRCEGYESSTLFLYGIGAGQRVMSIRIPHKVVSEMKELHTIQYGTDSSDVCCRASKFEEPTRPYPEEVLSQEEFATISMEDGTEVPVIRYYG